MAFASGGVRLNGRELLFGEAKNNTRYRTDVLSVK